MTWADETTVPLWPIVLGVFLYIVGSVAWVLWTERDE